MESKTRVAMSILIAVTVGLMLGGVASAAPSTVDLDSSWGNNGVVTTTFGRNTETRIEFMTILPDGKILAGGENRGSGGWDFALTRFNSDGTLDTTFGNGGNVITDFAGWDDYAAASALQPDGKIVLAGYSSPTGANFDWGLARYNSDGSLDTTFGSNGLVSTQVGTSFEYCHSVVIQPDGKIVAAGYTQISSEDYDIALVRYNDDGSLDSGFGNGGIVITRLGSTDERGQEVLLLADGKILVVGWTDRDYVLARYNSDGSLDAGFGNGGIVITDMFGHAQTAVFQPDGKLLVAGFHRPAGGTTDMAVLRYNSDGSLDTDFGDGGIAVIDNNGGFDSPSINTLHLMDDGKILLTGNSQVGDDTDLMLARFNSDGSIDSDFDGDGYVLADVFDNATAGRGIGVQADGGILAAGHANNGSYREGFVLRFVETTINESPNVEAGGPYAGNEGAAIPLDEATASDPDEDPLTYEWTVDATQCAFDDPTLLNPTLSCDDNGSFTATLTVSDGVNDPVSDDAEVNVSNVAPTADFAAIPGQILQGDSSTLSFSNQADPSPDDTAAGFLYSYDCTGDGTFEALDSPSATYDCPYTTPGTYEASGRIADKDDGATDYVTVVSVVPSGTPPDTFVVNDLGDAPDLVLDGVCDTDFAADTQCTLRAAIQESNAVDGSNTITFSVAGTISPQTELPTIDDLTGGVTIDATTAPGYVDTPVVALRGPGTDTFRGLVITSPNNVVRGLQITRFIDGIFITGTAATGNVIETNHLGRGPWHTVANATGVHISNAAGNLIGGMAANSGNLISGNGSQGILIVNDGPDGNVVQGNLIGTDPTGTQAVGNSKGILLGWTYEGPASGNLIGGTTPAARNIISGNRSEGIIITGGENNVIQGNYVGTDVTGMLALGNGSNGISTGDANHTTIGGAEPGAGNVISGNDGDGVSVISTDGFVIQGNFIGTDSTGTQPLGNAEYGIVFGAANGAIGGTTPGAGNVVSANGLHGIFLTNTAHGTENNLVQGNLIGTDATGTVPLGNASAGIFISGASRNTIGGPEPGAGNVVSANGGSGIVVDKRSFDNVIAGNAIGTDITGNEPLGNARYGVHIATQQPTDNTVGGTTPESANVISANGDHGVVLDRGAMRNFVRANFIGTDATGTAPLGNGGAGVFIDGSENVIGGLAPPPAYTHNTIAYNAGPGVLVANGVQNTIRRNAIFANDGLGIDLLGDGVTPNDPGDADSGPNELQNYPVLTSASWSGTWMSCVGTLSAKPDTVYMIDAYHSTTCDPSGFGEAEVVPDRPYSSTYITTDGSGNVAFSLSVQTPNPIPPGSFATVTVSEDIQWPRSNTSEFSNCVEIEMPNSPPSVDAGGPYSGIEGAAIPLDGATASDPDEDPLTFQWTVDSPLCGFDDDNALNPNLTCDDNGSFTVTLVVSDGVNDPVSDDAEVNVSNVAPTATLNAPANVNESDDINLSLTDPFDPSAEDTAAEFEYAFDCGAGFGPFSAGNSAVCPTEDDATLTVRGQIRDKDGGVTEYDAVVTVNNVAPTVDAGPDVTILEGETFASSGSFSDPGVADTWTATVDYDEGAGPEPLALTGYSFDLSNVYEVAGLYVVTVTVTDDDGDPGFDTAEVYVQTPSEAIEDVIDTIEEFDLGGGIENGLIAKLDAALSKLNDGNENNDGAAINNLEAFINQVEAQRGKKLTEEQADVLVAAAQAIIDSLSG